MPLWSDDNKRHKWKKLPAPGDYALDPSAGGAPTDFPLSFAPPPAPSAPGLAAPGLAAPATPAPAAAAPLTESQERLRAAYAGAGMPMPSLVQAPAGETPQERERRAYESAGVPQPGEVARQEPPSDLAAFEQRRQGILAEKAMGVAAAQTEAQLAAGKAPLPGADQTFLASVIGEADPDKALYAEKDPGIGGLQKRADSLSKRIDKRRGTITPEIAKRIAALRKETADRLKALEKPYQAEQAKKKRVDAEWQRKVDVAKGIEAEKPRTYRQNQLAAKGANTARRALAAKDYARAEEVALKVLAEYPDSNSATALQGVLDDARAAQAARDTKKLAATVKNFEDRRNDLDKQIAHARTERTRISNDSAYRRKYPTAIKDLGAQIEGWTADRDMVSRQLEGARAGHAIPDRPPGDVVQPGFGPDGASVPPPTQAAPASAPPAPAPTPVGMAPTAKAMVTQARAMSPSPAAGQGNPVYDIAAKMQQASLSGGREGALKVIEGPEYDTLTPEQKKALAVWMKRNGYFGGA